jgi:hypothetical protein
MIYFKLKNKISWCLNINALKPLFVFVQTGESFVKWFICMKSRGLQPTFFYDAGVCCF